MKCACCGKNKCKCVIDLIADTRVTKTGRPKKMKPLESFKTTVVCRQHDYRNETQWTPCGPPLGGYITVESIARNMGRAR